MGQFINFVPHVGENCILAMKNRQKIRPKQPETDMKLKF